MNKKLTPKIVVIIVLVALAAVTLYPPNKTLKPGIDLAGGTSLIYEIDTHGLTEDDKKDLAQKMITVLRRRIDPANIQNLVWRPQGNTRFEIQMPLSSAEARQQRLNYEAALDELLAENLSRSKIMRSLDTPAKERSELFKDFAQTDPNRLTILENLAAVYDERRELQAKRNQLDEKCKTEETEMASAGFALDLIRLNRNDWAKLTEEQLKDSLKEFADANDNLDLLTGYVKTYVEWSKIVDQLTDPNENAKYKADYRPVKHLPRSAHQVTETQRAARKAQNRFPRQARQNH